MIESPSLSSSLQVNPTVCRGCDACMLACSLFHAGVCNPALARLKVTKFIDRYRFTFHVCRHCEEPACLDACPVEGAMVRDEAGVVLIDANSCIACGSCATACPYDAIWPDVEESIYLKCDLCRGRVEGPLCAETCPTGALMVVRG